MAEKRKKKKKEPRQSWKPHWLPNFVYKLWLAVFAALKIAMGAVATVLLIGVVCGFVFVGILGNYLQEDILPNSEMIKENYDLDETSYIHYVDAEGKIQELQEIYAYTTDREWAPFDQIPEDLIHATVAIEDKRFYEHQGVDWITTVKACAGMFFGSGDAGGSTITQQLVKNMTGDNSVTVRRKVVEIFKAMDFEQRYDKDVIMEWYLNLIYFGDRKNGVKSAAAHYFGKELQNLTTAECAALISITNNPSIFSPYASTFEYDGKVMTGEERNRIRQVNTLWEMRNQGYLTEEEYRAALDQEMVFKSGIAAEDRLITCENVACGYTGVVGSLTVTDETHYCPSCGKEIIVGENASQEVYSWFVDTVLEDVAAALAEKDGVQWDSLTKEGKSVYLQLIQRSGYHIYTTLDMAVQNQVDKIYTNLEEIPETRGGQQLQSGIVVIDNRTGDIVAMAGGFGEKVIFDAYSMATDSQQQVGSSFKPIGVYAPAFELGVITPATVIKDMPLRYNTSDSGKTTPYPYNDIRSYSYSRTILDGIVSSVNAVSVNTLVMIGTRYSYNFAKDMFRISGLTDGERKDGISDVDYSPLAMGGLSYGATVRDVTNAYATFANQGVWREARTFTKVYDSTGNLVIDNVQEQDRILSEKSVEYMNYCLDKAVEYGTGTAASMDDIGIEVYGKTGTTNSLKVRYFGGYTGHYTAAVWCGYEIPAQIQLVGDYTNPALRLWKKVMKPLHQGKENIPLYDEENFVWVEVCLDSGKLADDGCKSDIRGIERTRKVMVYREDVPQEYCDSHIMLDYCSEGKAIANDYCKKFAEVGMLELGERALVKLTRAQIDAIEKAGRHGLSGDFISDSYIYQVNSAGDPVAFHGLDGDIEGDEPCLTCKKHTKKTWEEYKKENPWIDGGDTPQDPTTEPEGETPTDSQEQPKPEESSGEGFLDWIGSIFG